jgi:ADP-heptose:LPS heptosyltransferase
VDLRFILIGSAAERAQAETLATPRPNRTWNACGELEIGPLAGVLARCSLFLGNDSGPAHLAAAVGIPSVTLMSGIHSRGVWDPFAANATVLRHSVPCAPCHSEKACPLHTAACIRDITPQRVSEACRAALA